MRRMGTFQVKTHLSEILESVQQGEEILITKRGEPIAMITPYKESRPNVKSTISDFRKWREGIHWGKEETIKEAKEKGRK